jgi:glycosyltransferase involved in cell wall biosynthesis
MTQAKKFTIIFAGNMGIAQGLDSVIEAANLLSTLRPNIVFKFVGSGIQVEELKALVEKMGLNNVAFIPRVPMSKVGDILKSADALLIHLKNNPLFSVTIPSKIQAYMAIGKPLLAGVIGDSSDLISRADCGIIFLPENPQSLADQAVYLADLDQVELTAMGARGKDYYEKNMSLNVGAERFAQHFTRLARNA